MVCCRTIAQLRRGIEAGDFAQSERLAHTIEGLAGSIGARRVRTAAQRLEGALANTVESLGVGDL
jgi:HPt (histidine-containing phosphotransfer) domain-containing protein